MADIKVQRGTNDIGNTGGTDTGFTAVSATSAAFEFNSNSMFTHAGSTSSGGNMEGDDMSGAVELTGTGTLTFTRQSGSLAQNMRYDWQLIEYTGAASGANEFIVRSRNTITMSGTSTTASLGTTPTNIDNCVPIVTGVRTSQTSNQGDELRIAAHINDSGSLVVEKGSTTTTTIVQVVVVEFTGSNWEVYHGTATGAGDTGTITLNTDSDGAGGSTGDVTDWADAFIIGGFTSTDQGLDSVACRYQPGSGTTTVNWDFQSGNSSSHKHFVHVVRHPDMVVTRYTPTGSAANDTNVSITSASLTSLDTAMIIGTCQGSGGGTAYGRNWRNYRLTTTSNAQHYCHRSGNTINHAIQIVDFEAIEDTGGSTITGTGALTAASVTASGVGEIAKTGTGALTAPHVTLSATGASYSTIAGTGSLTAAGATIAGTGTVTRVGTGSLDAAPVALAGVGVIEKTGTGALAGPVTELNGVGAIAGSIAGTGSLTAAGATIAGTGTVTRVGTGSLNAGPVALAGVGAVGAGIVGTGELTTAGVSASGAGIITRIGGGALSLSATTLAGVGNIAGAITGSGELTLTLPQAVSAGVITRNATGSLNAPAVLLNGLTEAPIAEQDKSLILRARYRVIEPTSSKTRLTTIRSRERSVTLPKRIRTLKAK